MSKKKADTEKKEQEIPIKEGPFETEAENSVEEKEVSQKQHEEKESDVPGEQNGSSEEGTMVIEEKDIKKLLTKIKTLEEQNLRLRAEFANYKKRIERDQHELADYIKGKIFEKLLPILDDLKIMIEKSSEEHSEQSVLEGAKLIYEKFNQLLEKEGLTKINALGEKFDPQLHEALMMHPIDEESKHETVIEVYQEGYKLHDKLLRPSKVVVGKYESNHK